MYMKQYQMSGLTVSSVIASLRKHPWSMASRSVICYEVLMSANFISSFWYQLEEALGLNFVVGDLIKKSSISLSKEMPSWSIFLLEKPVHSQSLCVMAQWLCHPYTVGINTQTGIAPILQSRYFSSDLHLVFCAVTRSITQELGGEICRIYSETNLIINICTETKKKKKALHGWHS